MVPIQNILQIKVRAASFPTERPDSSLFLIAIYTGMVAIFIDEKFKLIITLKLTLLLISDGLG